MNFDNLLLPNSFCLSALFSYSFLLHSTFFPAPSLLSLTQQQTLYDVCTSCVVVSGGAFTGYRDNWCLGLRTIFLFTVEIADSFKPGQVSQSGDCPRKWWPYGLLIFNRIYIKNAAL